MRKKLLRSRSGFEKPESREEAIMQNILGASNVLEPSESNIEEILKSILYNTPYTKEAEFEIEKILLAIKNNGTYDGKGESRDMKILIAILNDLDYTEEAESRIEELFIEWLHQRSSIKVLEGVPPLTFTANGQPLLDYLISGNTVQNGTPTPDNPIMPQGTGERTGNLFDSINFEQKCIVIRCTKSVTETGLILTATSKDPYINTVVANGQATPTQFYEACISVKPSTDYILSANKFLKCYISYLNDNYVGVVGFSTIPENTSSFSFTTASNCTKILIRLGADIQIGETVEFSNLMLIEGSTAPTSYIPYGYKIPISSANTTTPVYLGEVQTTRKIKKLVLDGTETWKQSSFTGAFYCSDAPFGATYLHRQMVTTVCSHYNSAPNKENTSDLSDGELCLFAYMTETSLLTQEVYVKDNNIIDAAAFKTFLATQYANGTPVTVWYVLANPETAVVNEPLMKIGDYADTLSKAQAGVEIPTVSGSNTLDVNTTVKPSNIYIEYK